MIGSLAKLWGLFPKSKWYQTEEAAEHERSPVSLHSSQPNSDSVVKNPPVNAGDMGLIPDSWRSPGGENGNLLQYSCLKNPIDGWAWIFFPPWIRHAIESLPLLPFVFCDKKMINLRPEKAMATHSSTLAWKIPWREEPGRLQSMGSRRVQHDWATSLSLFTFLHWRRKWQPTPVFLPGESQGQRSLVGCHLWDHRVGHD